VVYLAVDIIENPTHPPPTDYANLGIVGAFCVYAAIGVDGKQPGSTSIWKKVKAVLNTLHR
jgi:hypothetical protein